MVAVGLTTTLLATLCVVAIIPGECLLLRRLRRDASSEEVVTLNGTEIEDEDTNTLRAISFILGQLGVQLMVQLVEERILKLYKTELSAKTKDCKWTDKDSSKWDKKLKEIKLIYQNSTELDAVLGLEEFQKKDNLTVTAKWTLGILEDMENVTRAFVIGEASDLIILKYGAYLREKMLSRRTKNPSCFWTEEDRQRAAKVIHEVTNQLATDTLNGVAQTLGTTPEELFSTEDVKEFKIGFENLKHVYEPLFDPFEED